LAAIERTEDQIISKSPLKVILGEKDYFIKPLTILKQREWRTKLNEEMAGIIANFNPSADNKTMVNGLTGALVAFPEKIADLVFAYAPDLPKDEILETATEEQIASTFSAVMALAFPFLAQLKLITTLTRAKLSQSLR
jgi:hypothetical protein